MRYHSPVLNAVAYPPTMMFVPVQLAGLNIGINVGLMMLGMAAADIPPIPFLVIAIAGHVAMATWSARDAHLVTLAKAIGMRKQSSRNIIPARGVKYVP